MLVLDINGAVVVSRRPMPMERITYQHFETKIEVRIRRGRSSSEPYDQQ